MVFFSPTLKPSVWSGKRSSWWDAIFTNSMSLLDYCCTSYVACFWKNGDLGGMMLGRMILRSSLVGAGIQSRKGKFQDETEYGSLLCKKISMSWRRCRGWGEVVGGDLGLFWSLSMHCRDITAFWRSDFWRALAIESNQISGWLNVQRHHFLR